MKLIDDFFNIIETYKLDTEYHATIQLKPNHLIYSGHFPGYPVTPGVIQLQIVHEILETWLGRKFKLNTVRQCKFLKVLNPEETVEMVIHLKIRESEGQLNIKAWGSNGPDVFFKLHSNYQ